MACLPYATFSFGEWTTFSQLLRKEKRQQHKLWNKPSLLLANTEQQLSTHRFKATSSELWAPKPQMALSPTQKAEVLRDELSAHRGSPQHWEEGDQEQQTSKPQVLMLLQSLSSTISYCDAWQTLSSHTAELPGCALSPHFHSRCGKSCGGDRGFSTRVPKVPQYTTPGEFGQKLLQGQEQLCWNEQGILFSLNTSEMSNNAKFIWKIAHHF